jgi:hypothetical protein
VNILDTVLPDDDRELLIRPFDARWEAIITIYEGNKTRRGVSRSPLEAIERAEKNLDPVRA